LSSKKSSTLYGIIAVLVALLIIVASVAGYYAAQYSQELQANHTYVSELNSVSEAYSAAASKYNSLAEQYNGSLSSLRELALLYNESVGDFNTLTSTYESLESQYNASLSLLVSAVSELNTSTPAYQNASTSLASLWRSLSVLALKYSTAASQFANISASFMGILASSGGNASLLTNESSFLRPAKPLLPTSLFHSSILLDFGNGTNRWYNDTQVEPGWNLYIATLLITNGNLDATWYPQYGEHYVTGVDGVQNSATKYWFLWVYNESSLSWQNPQVGADQLPTFNGSIFAWTYCGENPSTYIPECIPGS